MYAPLQGRFVSRDPIQEDLNGYEYVRNHPTIARDPSGAATLYEATGSVPFINASFPRELPWKHRAMDDLGLLTSVFVVNCYCKPSVPRAVSTGKGAAGACMLAALKWSPYCDIYLNIRPIEIDKTQGTQVFEVQRGGRNLVWGWWCVVRQTVGGPAPCAAALVVAARERWRLGIRFAK